MLRYDCTQPKKKTIQQQLDHVFNIRQNQAQWSARRWRQHVAAIEDLNNDFWFPEQISLWQINGEIYVAGQTGNELIIKEI